MAYGYAEPGAGALDIYAIRTANVAQSTILGDRPMTELENLTAQMADTARNLRTAADRIQGRIDGFMQEARQLAPEKDAPRPEPQPGTLSALRYWHAQIEEQTSRLSSVASNLAGIL